MAVSGSGSKVFIAGAKLLASEVNGYLMRQSLMQFDTTALRDTAFTSGTGEGPHVYTADKDQVWYHNGTTWVMKEGWGTGSPEGLVTGAVGAVWHRIDGGTGTTMYVKESGSGATGWAAHGAAGYGTFDVTQVKNTVAEVIATGTETAITWDTEDSDTSNQHSTVSNTDQIVIATTGTYEIDGQAAFASNATGYRIVYIKNGAVYLAIATNPSPTATASCTVPIVPFTVQCTAGDIIRMTVIHSAGGNLNVNGEASDKRSTFLRVKRVA